MSTRKRSALNTLELAAQARNGVATQQERAKIITTAISLPPKTYDLLRTVASKRASVGRNRFSVSKVIADLVEENRVKLEHEAT